MPLLENPRHEAFAQARAKGARLEDAYEDAGFTPGNRHASRLAERREVIDRIAELRALQADLCDANLQGVVASLLRVAKASEAPLAPPGGNKTPRSRRARGRAPGERAIDQDHEGPTF